jgi:hypothetical protein
MSKEEELQNCGRLKKDKESLRGKIIGKFEDRQVEK